MGVAKQPVRLAISGAVTLPPALLLALMAFRSGGVVATSVSVLLLVAFGAALVMLVNKLPAQPFWKAVLLLAGSYLLFEVMLLLVLLAFGVGGVGAAAVTVLLLTAVGAFVAMLHALRERPFWQAVGLLVAAYLVFEPGITHVPPLFGIASSPAPQSVVLQYMLTALVGVLLYVSDNEERWRQFKRPIHAALVDSDKRWVRGSFLVLLPVLVGFVTFDRVRPKVSAPLQLRSIHPAPPGEIRFRGQTIQLAGLENPLRSSGSMEEHVATGRRVYYQNCLPCHGDLLDGEGHFGHGFNPAPLPFDDAGTIAQLTESYVFWRIAKGGPGLPREGTPWNSAMPVWEDFLTEEEIWSVIIFLYEQSEFEPRRWEIEGEGEGGGR